MSVQIIRSKEVAKTWLAVENGLSVALANQYVSVPHDSRFDFEVTDAFTLEGIYEHKGSSVRVLVSKLTGTTGASNLKGYYVYITNTTMALVLAYGDGTSTSLVFAGVNQIEGKTYTWRVTWNNGTYTYWINGIRIRNTTTTGHVGKSIKNTGNLILGNRLDTVANSGLNGMMEQVVVYNKAISIDEASLIKQEIGIVPVILHTNCVGHWTLNQRYGVTAWDSVAQYNYAKTTALVPTHGTLIGYTDAEVGINGQPKESATAYVNHYTKTFVAKINSSGIDLKSGLPEITKALRVGNIDGSSTVGATTKYLQATTGFRLASGYMAFYFYWSGFTSPNVEQYLQTSRGSSSQTTSAVLIETTGAIRFFYRQNVAGSNVVVSNIRCSNLIPVVGLNCLVVSKRSLSAQNDIEISLNGIRGVNTVLSDTKISVTPNDYGLISEVTTNLLKLGTTFNVSDVQTNPLNGFILAAIYSTKPLSKIGDAATFFSNGMLRVPYGDFTNVFIVNSIEFDGTNYQIKNAVSGSTIHMNLKNYTANERNPVHADYVIKGLDTLR